MAFSSIQGNVSTDNFLALRYICIKTGLSLPFNYGGYKQDLLENPLTPLEKLTVLCSVCDGVMRCPHLTDKGYKCTSCLGNSKSIKLAKETETEINKLKVHCPFKKEGCLWDDKLSSLILHMEICELFPLKCPLGCKKTMMRKYIKEHVDKKCVERETTCEYCNYFIKVSKTNVHSGTCSKFPLECVNGCSSNTIARNKMDLHISKECPLSVVPCPFKRYGCSTVRKRRDIETHEAEFVVKHVRIMNARIEEMEEEIQYSRGLSWEIHGVKDKFSRDEELYSEPFYVNRYKFKGLAQLKSSEGFLGIFVILCQGENDDNLAWPFLGNVIITLINKRDSNSSITDSFTTAGNINFTKRSSLQMGGYGIPKFITRKEVLDSKFSGWEDSIKIHFEVQHLPQSSFSSRNL